MESDRAKAKPESGKSKSHNGGHRKDLASALERDFERRRRREQGHRSFWKWLGLLGMVGWPIAFTTVGGALWGHYLDVRFNSGIQFTLLLLTIGVVIGSLVAWNVIGKDR